MNNPEYIFRPSGFDRRIRYSDLKSIEDGSMDVKVFDARRNKFYIGHMNIQTAIDKFR